jgi:hypothetical protein
MKKIFIKSKVMHVKVLNLNLDLLSKDLEMKLVGIIEEYEAFPLSKNLKFGIFCESYGVLKIVV